MAVITTIRSAFGFLTRLPVGPWPLQNDLNGISAWLPLVGLVVGGLAGGLTWTATLLFPPLVCGIIGCACWVAVTGGLHLDGVADCGDGLPIEVSRERRLEIMKDSRLGTFGGTALFFNLAFKGAALATLAAHGSWELLLTACALAGLLARSQIFIAMRFPGARPGGMGEAFKQGTRPGHALAAAAVTLAACALAGWNGLYALLSALAGSMGLLLYARRRLGGVTGDVFGCTVECTEWLHLLHFMKTPHKCRVPGLNIGCTSFIIPDYYVPAIRECVHYADDVALLLLEAGECGKELITPAEIRELAGIAADAGVTWNVHLPTDGGFATEESSRRYTENIIRAIDLTRELEPHTWVMHVVTDHIPGPDMRPHLTECETERILRSLEQITPHLPAPECLALENLERHPTDYLDKLVAATPHSRCFDIGHVWKEGLRPEKLLPLWLPDIRMCHLHGLEKRDHKSLHHMPAATLDAILHPMWDLHFSPLITLEVFSLDDFLNSHQAMLESHERYITKH